MSVCRVRDRRGFLRRVVSNPTLRGVDVAAARTALYPASLLYRAVVAAHRGVYALGLKRTRRLPVPVISIGNISTGGTGKTPVAEWVARWLHEQGRRPAILSRGYGAKVSPGDEVLNDEAAILRENLPVVLHLCSADRATAGRRAIAEHGADVLVLDDGFQHRRLHRDLDIVLVDALAPPHRDYLLPCGILREPLFAIRKAHVVIVTRSDLATPSELAEVCRVLRAVIAPEVPLILAAHRPVALELMGRGETPAALRGRPVFVFCGIGNPEGFRRTLLQLGADVRDMVVLPDHCTYGDRQLRELERLASGCGASLAVTTQKDAVKVRQRWQGPPLGVLRVALEIRQGRDALEAALMAVIQR